MLHTKIKDLKHRKKYHKFEKKHLIDTFLFKNIMSKIHSQNVNSSLKKKIIFKCFKKKNIYELKTEIQDVVFILTAQEEFYVRLKCQG